MEQKKSTKYILIAISVLFIFVMLILPLFSILFSALKEGFAFYLQAVTTEYVRSALLVTLLATVIAVVVNTFFGIVAAWLLTKFSFRGKQVLATLIDIPFSISPVIVGLAFLMTFVFRNKHPHYVCVTGCCACHNFCHFPVCIA